MAGKGPRHGGLRMAVGGIPRWLFGLFAVGIALRLALMAVYTPAALQNPDTISYLTIAPFHDTRQPSGLNLFVVPFGWIGSLPLLVLAEHALGVLAAALLAAAARRLGCGWVATGVVAAAALLTSEELYVEHAVLTEPLFTALAAGALLASLPRAGRDGLAAPSAAGVIAGAAMCTRSIGVVVIAATMVAPLLATGDGVWRRVLRSGAATAGAAAVLGLYLLGVGLTPNGQAGLTDWSGWYTYARSASFADCTRFTPPAGTRMLCETTPPGQRPGPSYYIFDPASPARRAFGGPPTGGSMLARFGRAAILGEPTAYAHVVLRDFVRYFDDRFGSARPAFGGGYDTIALDRRDPIAEQSVAAQASHASFGTVVPSVVHAQHLLQLYAATFALDGRTLLGLLLLAAAAVPLARGRSRRGALLYGLVALALLALPVMTISYEARYALPPALLLTVPAAVGTEALGRRVGGGRRPQPAREQGAAELVSRDEPAAARRGAAV